LAPTFGTRGGNAWNRTVTKGKYLVELFKDGAGNPGQEEIVDRHDNLTVARAIYRGRVSQYPGRMVSSGIALASWREATGQRRCPDAKQDANDQSQPSVRRSPRKG
jgi:hypothetical protein